MGAVPGIPGQGQASVIERALARGYAEEPRPPRGGRSAIGSGDGSLELGTAHVPVKFWVLRGIAMTDTPTKFPRTAFTGRDEPKCRVILPPARGGWSEPVLFE